MENIDFLRNSFSRGSELLLCSEARWFEIQILKVIWTRSGTCWQQLDLRRSEVCKVEKWIAGRNSWLKVDVDACQYCWRYRAEVATIGGVNHLCLVRFVWSRGGGRSASKKLIECWCMNAWRVALLINDIGLLEWSVRYQIAMHTAQGLC